MDPIIGYLDINVLLNKIDALIKLIKVSPNDTICIDETKLDSSFLNREEIGRVEGRSFFSRRLWLQIDLMIFRQCLPKLSMWNLLFLT